MLRKTCPNPREKVNIKGKTRGKMHPSYGKIAG
jgi:hypothetical protein